MGHMPLVNAAKDLTGHYNFLPFFEYCAPFFAKADIVTGNLETTLSNNALSYSGYPQFCTPEELATGLKSAGFTLITTANNHSFDKGEKGVLSTLDWLDSAALLHTGTFKCSTDAVTPVVIVKNSLRIAFLAYTTLLNGFVLPIGKPYLVNMYSLEKLTSDITAAKAAGADFIVCSLHFGNEYQRFVTPYQQKLVDTLFMCGVDLVLGSHPHVLVRQRIDTLNHLAAIYSLGNFISNQQDKYTKNGDIAYFALEKNINTGIRTVHIVGHEPTYVYKWYSNEKIHYRVLPLSLIDSEDSAFPFHYLKRPGALQAILDHIYGKTVAPVPASIPRPVPYTTQPQDTADTII
jgi:poly-gamma-glutamate synthesis protein (capsule biosynthesis protein)